VRGRAPIKGLRACDDLLSSTVLASFSVLLVGVARSRLGSRQPSRLASPAGAFVTCVARVLDLFSFFALFFSLCRSLAPYRHVRLVRGARGGHGWHVAKMWQKLVSHQHLLPQTE
jgi:hypothetical protein